MMDAHNYAREFNQDEVIARMRFALEEAEEVRVGGGVRFPSIRQGSDEMPAATVPEARGVGQGARQ